jgi:choline-sulfatase
MRAESVGCYGHPVVKTPNFDRLAEEGVRFDQCHVQHTVCTPSRCSFMTGWYPHVRGHRTLWHSLQPDEPNLLKYLKQGGYTVKWWGKNDLLSQDSFEDSVTTAGSAAGRQQPDRQVVPPLSDGPPRGHGPANPFDEDDPRYYSFLYEPMDIAPDQQGDWQCVQRAIDFLKSKPSEPFCIYLPITFPHCPYRAPQPWHDMVNPDALPPLRSAEGERMPEFHSLIRSYRRLDQVDETVFRKINAIYLGMISFVDHMLGRLLDALDEAGLTDSTTVFAFSDHGDWAGDRGLVEKWPSALDDCLTRVPMIVRAPGNAAGHVVCEPVEAFDMMATVLELAGISPTHTHYARSMCRQLRGASGDPKRAVFAEGGYDPHEPHCFEGHPPRRETLMSPGHIYFPKLAQQQEHPESVCRATMIRTMTHKLVRRPHGLSELYDLAADPEELINRYGDPELADVQADLEKRLLDWYIHTADSVPWYEDPRGHFGERKRYTGDYRLVPVGES